MRPALSLLLVLIGFMAAVAARASQEEFATLDVAAPETDDEYAIDLYLARTPEAWREEWESAPAALRTDQGCMTAAHWYQSSELKARSSMGPNAWLDVRYFERTDFEASWQWLQFDFMAATPRFGAFGLRFRPARDKSRHDFAALWRAGADRAPLQVQTAFTFEDTFNTLWEFRQSQVGDHFEPYRAHPFEPALRVLSRGAGHRVEIAGTWLTPSRREIVDPDPERSGSYSLWGSRAFLEVEGMRGPWSAVGRFDGAQALSSERLGTAAGAGRVHRGRWIAEGALRRRLSPRVRIEGRYLYTSRVQTWRQPAASGGFAALDRVGAAELDWRARENWRLRVGFLYDRVAVAREGHPPMSTYGSRKESRAFIGLQARVGRVRLQGVECIELDAEPYPVSFHHDKGSLNLQTTF